MKRQEKQLRAKLRLQQGEDEDAGDDDEGDEEVDTTWGAKKRAYYGEGDEEASMPHPHA